MIVEGGRAKGTIVEGYNDAAITMSLCVAGLIAEGNYDKKTQILDIAYPEFITVLNNYNYKIINKDFKRGYKPLC